MISNTERSVVLDRFPSLSDDLSEGSKSSISSTSYIKYATNIPKSSDIIFKSSGYYSSPEGKTIQGDMVITYNSLTFVPKHNIYQWSVEIDFSDIKILAKINRRGFEKGLEIVLSDSQKVIFSSFQNRDKIVSFIKLLTESHCRVNQSFGFNSKDETEVIKRITLLKAPHVFEETINTNLKTIIEILKKPENITEILTMFGSTGLAVSDWTRNKDGLTRTVHYVQPMFQPLSVTSTNNIMKSGDSLAFDVYSKFSRTSDSNVLNMRFQLFFKKEGETVTYRGAYSLDFNVEVYDKEFIEKSVSRQNKMFYYFMKSKFCNEEFNDDDYVEQWKKHQPYVLTIIALLLSLLGILLLPKNTNWLAYLCGTLILFLFYLI